MGKTGKKNCITFLLLLGLMINASFLNVTGQEFEHILKIGLMEDLTSLNPFFWRTESDLTILRLIYDTLFRVDAQGLPVPNLATSWAISENGLTYTLHLVNNRTWHNGEQMTIDDVVYSLEFIQNHGLPYARSIGAVIDSVAEVGPWSVRLNLTQPFAPLPLLLAEMGFVVPKSIWKDLDDPEDFENEEPIGNGPFKFVERDEDSFIQLEANKDYWRGAPHIDGLLFKIFSSPEDQAQSIRRGEIDVMSPFPGSQIRTLMVTKDLAIIRAPTTTLHYLDINLRRYPMSEKPFRKALAHAIDKDKLIQVLLDGFGDPANSVMPPNLVWYNPNLPTYEYNPSLTASLLDEMNLKDLNEDGFRENATGAALTLNMVTFAEMHWPQLNDLIAEMLNDVGLQVTLTITNQSTTEYIKRVTYDYDISSGAWKIWFDPDPYLYESFHSSRDLPGGLNWVGFHNTSFDTIVEQQRAEPINLERRRELVFQLQETLTEELPWIPLYYPDFLYAIRTDTFTGWIELPRYGLLNLWNVLNVRPVGLVEVETLTVPTTITQTSVVAEFGSLGYTILITFVVMITVVSLGIWRKTCRETKETYL